MSSGGLGWSLTISRVVVVQLEPQYHAVFVKFSPTTLLLGSIHYDGLKEDHLLNSSQGQKVVINF